MLFHLSLPCNLPWFLFHLHLSIPARHKPACCRHSVRMALHASKPGRTLLHYVNMTFVFSFPMLHRSSRAPILSLDDVSSELHAGKDVSSKADGLDKTADENLGVSSSVRHHSVVEYILRPRTFRSHFGSSRREKA